MAGVKLINVVRSVLGTIADDEQATRLLSGALGADLSIEDVRNWRVHLDLGPVEVEASAVEGEGSASVSAGPVVAELVDTDDDGKPEFRVRWDGRKHVRERAEPDGKGLWAKIRARKAAKRAAKAG